MRTTLLGISCAALVALAGCATPEYVGPNEGPRARLRLASDTHFNVVVTKFDAEDCKTGAQKMVQLGRVLMVDAGQGRSLGMPLAGEYHKDNATELYVSARRPFIALFAWGYGSVYSGYKACRITGTFQPRENYDYEAVFTPPSPDRCSLVFYRLAKTASGSVVRVKEETARASSMQCERIVE